jgi:hypothetical protein
MKKLIGIKILAIALILATLSTDTMAQTRIRFARGRSATTLGGAIPSGGTRAYIIRLGDGQDLTVDVTSGNDNIQIDIDDVHGHINYYDNYANLTTDADGDHYITLKNQGGRATRYTMTVTAR